jgi:hypothetical protein
MEVGALAEEEGRTWARSQAVRGRTESSRGRAGDSAELSISKMVLSGAHEYIASPLFGDAGAEVGVNVECGGMKNLVLDLSRTPW